MARRRSGGGAAAHPRGALPAAPLASARRSPAPAATARRACGRFLAARARPHCQGRAGAPRRPRRGRRPQRTPSNAVQSLASHRSMSPWCSDSIAILSARVLQATRRAVVYCKRAPVAAARDARQRRDLSRQQLLDALLVRELREEHHVARRRVRHRREHCGRRGALLLERQIRSLPGGGRGGGGRKLLL